MKLSDLEKTLRQEYDSKRISPAVRGIVLEYLRGHPSVREEDLVSVKVFTKVAANAFLDDHTDFNLSLVDRLLTYHDEGIVAGREKYQQTQAGKFHSLYIHLASHAVELIDELMFSDKEMSKEHKVRLLRRGLDLVELVQTEADKDDSDHLLCTKREGVRLAFHLYTETGDLRYAEQGYQAMEDICSSNACDPTGYSVVLNHRSIFASKVRAQLCKDSRAKRSDVVLWATRAYEAADDDLPFPAVDRGHHLYHRASAAEDLYRMTQNNTWKKRALRAYGRFLEYRQEHLEEQSPPYLESHAQSFVRSESRK